MTTKEAPKQPIHKIRIAGISASIWENKAENGTRYNVTLDRSYKDGGKWKQSGTFGYQDLPTLAKVIDLAFDAIHYMTKAQVEGDQDETN